MAPGFDVKNITKRCSPCRPQFNNFSRNDPEIEQKIDWFFGPESIGKSITPVIIKMSAVSTSVELAVPSVEAKVKKPRGPRKKDVAAPAAASLPAEAEAETKVKKPRAPVLPAKYSKFVQFAFYLVNKLNDDAAIAGLAPVIDAGVVYDAVALMGDIDSQKEAIEGFFGSLKETKQAIKKHIAGQKKAEAKEAKAQAKKEAKAGQEKKPRGPRKKKADADAEVVEGETQPVKKEKKAKKAKTEDDFVADMVSLATNAQPVAPAENIVTEITEKKEPAKRGRKPKAVAEPEQEPEVKAAAEPEVKAKKPKTKKESKAAAPAPVPATDASADASADADEEVVVDTLEFNGKTYLVDDNNVVFDFESHDPVGKLVNNAVVFDA